MPEKSGSPTEIFKELLNSKFHVFLEYEDDPNITSSGRVITSLIRSVFSHNPRNIRTAINRVDGLLPQQVEIILPKVYYRYPRATAINSGVSDTQSDGVTETLPETPSEPAARSVTEMTVRQATAELGKLPYSTVDWIISQASATANWYKTRGQQPVPEHTPYLKSVIAAHFVKMAAAGIPDVVEDFFDSIDGKLSETIRLGDDIFILKYDKEAPPGAIPGDDGVLQIEVSEISDMWGKALQKGKK